MIGLLSSFRASAKTAPSGAETAPSGANTALECATVGRAPKSDPTPLHNVTHTYALCGVVRGLAGHGVREVRASRRTAGLGGTVRAVLAASTFRP